MPAITPNLWFDTEGKEAAEFYVSIFPNSKITNVSYYNGTPALVRPAPALPSTSSSTGSASQPSTVDRSSRSARPSRCFITCADQAEVDYYSVAAHRWRGGEPVRLAEGPLRAVVAGRAGRHGGDAGRPRSGPRHPGHERHARHEEDRPGGAEGAAADAGVTRRTDTEERSWGGSRFPTTASPSRLARRAPPQRRRGGEGR